MEKGKTMSTSQIQRLKNYLDKRGISWRPTEQWSLIFSGNHPEGIFIGCEDARPVRNFLDKLDGLDWEFRGHYSSIYVRPKI